MKHVREKVTELRAQYEALREDRIPIDVFSFFEIDLRLDAIPLPNLASRYRADAAIKADFSGIYLDAEQYELMEEGPEWKLNRLRFTVAHELAHYFLHSKISPSDLSSVSNLSLWTKDYGGNKYEVEQEANEFAGCLLVPVMCLAERFNAFAAKAPEIAPNFKEDDRLRHDFAGRIAPRFGVNTQVVEVRLDREGIWPAM